MTTAAQEYLSEEVSFGGETCSRGAMINKLREIAPSEQCVQMYLAGHSREQAIPQQSADSAQIKKEV